MQTKQRKCEATLKLCLQVAISGVMTLLLLHSSAEAAKAKSKRPAAASSATYDFFYQGRYISTTASRSAGLVTIKDRAGNVLWKAKSSDLGKVYYEILPRELDRLFKSATHLHRIGSYQQSLLSLADLERLLPGNPLVLYWVGSNHASLNETDAAEKAFKRALTSYASDLDTLTALASLQFSADRFEEAIANYKKAMATVGPKINKALAVDERNLGHFINAGVRDEYVFGLNDRLAALKQSLIFAYSRQADTLYYKGNQKGALAAIEKAMALAPRQPGLMETYRIYSVFLPPPANLEQPQNDYEIWSSELTKQIESNNFEQAFNLVRHLRSLYPKKNKLIKQATTITKKIAAGKNGYEKIDFMLRAAERDKELIEIKTAVETELNAIVQQDPIPAHFDDLITLGNRLLGTGAGQTAKNLLANIHLLYARELFTDNALAKAKEIATARAKFSNR